MIKHTRQTIIALIDECRANNKPIDLNDQDLSSLDLSGADLRGADLRGANLRDTDLWEANLQDADLQRCILQRAYLQRANLWGANLQRADLQEANLQEAYLRDTNLDFTGIELSCKTIGVMADSRLISQLLYHLCRMNVHGCPEWDELRNDPRVMALANQSHVVNVYKQPEIEPLEGGEL